MKDKFKYYFEFLIDGTKKMFKEFFNKDTNKRQRANMWTFSRLIAPFIALIISLMTFVSNNPTRLFIISGIVTALGGLTDFFDGRSARKYNSTSNFGKVLDQLTDKIFSIVTTINLLICNLGYLMVLFGEILICSVNIFFKAKYPEIDTKSSKIGRIKQWPLFISLALGFLSPLNSTLFKISNISIVVTSITQIIVAINYFNINVKQIEKIKIYKQNNLLNNQLSINLEDDKSIKEIDDEYIKL